jgi:hypothetical protein
VDEDNTVIEPSPQKRWGTGDTGTNFRPDGRAQAGGFQLGSSAVPAAVIAPTAPTAPIEPWLSNLCFGELVAEVRHLIGNALEGVAVGLLAVLTFILSDGVGGAINAWSGENGGQRAQSNGYRDCGGEQKSSRRYLNRCHNHHPLVLVDDAWPKRATVHGI